MLDDLIYVPEGPGEELIPAKKEERREPHPVLVFSNPEKIGAPHEHFPGSNPCPNEQFWNEHLKRYLDAEKILQLGISMKVIQQRGSHCYFEGKYLGNGQSFAARNVIADYDLEATIRMAVKTAGSASATRGGDASSHGSAWRVRLPIAVAHVEALEFDARGLRRFLGALRATRAAASGR